LVEAFAGAAPSLVIGRATSKASTRRIGIKAFIRSPSVLCPKTIALGPIPYTPLENGCTVFVDSFHQLIELLGEF
jgi:hypothetical protein